MLTPSGGCRAERSWRQMARVPEPGRPCAANRKLSEWNHLNVFTDRHCDVQKQGQHSGSWAVCAGQYASTRSGRWTVMGPTRSNGSSAGDVPAPRWSGGSSDGAPDSGQRALSETMGDGPGGNLGRHAPIRTTPGGRDEMIKPYRRSSLSGTYDATNHSVRRMINLRLFAGVVTRHATVGLRLSPIPHSNGDGRRQRRQTGAAYAAPRRPSRCPGLRLRRRMWHCPKDLGR
jgi:hypothetical protein